MKATVLVDNLPHGTLKSEWGLSIYIEYGALTVLLDAGASALFAENAKALGKPLERVDLAVLSHAHYDHGNGMARFFAENDRAKFHLRAPCGENCYARKFLFRRYIGLPRSILTQYPHRIALLSGDCEVVPSVWLIGHKTPGLSAVGKREKMFLRENGAWRYDDFGHEQSLIFDTPDGLIIFNSCCHAGADTVVREALETFPGRQPLAVIGGFHLFNKPPDEVRAFARRLQATGVRHIYTGHCTGDAAYAVLKNELGDAVEQLRVGLVMEF